MSRGRLISVRDGVLYVSTEYSSLNGGFPAVDLG